jgi:hypothetical protein
MSGGAAVPPWSRVAISLRGSITAVRDGAGATRARAAFASGLAGSALTGAEWSWRSGRGFAALEVAS